MAPELLAAVQALLDIAVDVRKGSKAGGIPAALMADADLLAKLEVVVTKISAIPADLKALTMADVVPLISILIPGIESVIAA